MAAEKVIRRSKIGYMTLAICCLAISSLNAQDWTQFRGNSGNGISTDTKIPLTWSESENLKWKTPLPGAGSSSPIVIGNHIFVTCFSGQDKLLKRHLVCLYRNDGKIKWSKAVDAVQPEDGYQGYLTEHGYASNTPTTDGERVYVFFGKTGVLAFDFDGEQLWQVNVGNESSDRHWGSAASLILYKNSVIVNAAEESRSVRGLDKKTGKELWKAEGGSLELAYGTPALVDLDEGNELVVGVPGEIWGLNPDTGKLNWYADTKLTGNICPSIVYGDGVGYLFGGFRSSGSLAFRPGGKDDVSKSHVLWSGRNSSYVATPLLYEGHLYWVDDRGLAFCVEAKTGELVYKERLRDLKGGGRQFYASPVLADGKLYVVSRRNGTFVFAAKPKFEQLAHNNIEDDESDFNATPAISSGRLILRSNKFLYCVTNE